MRKYRWKSSNDLPRRGNIPEDMWPPTNCASLPKNVERDLRGWIEQALSRHGLPTAEEIVEDIVHEVSYAFAGRQHLLNANGAGRPPDGVAMLLSVNVADLLEKRGIQGNWQTWPGRAGPVTELEVIAQTALRLACGGAVGVLARPARISEARKALGKVHRYNPLPKLDPN